VNVSSIPSRDSLDIADSSWFLGALTEPPPLLLPDPEPTFPEEDEPPIDPPGTEPADDPPELPPLLLPPLLPLLLPPELPPELPLELPPELLLPSGMVLERGCMNR
jgi:hypothetical protein